MIPQKSLGVFFESYRKSSLLPSPILDYILDLYKRRNTVPLAGHGHLDVTTIKNEEAIVLAEMTKAFVRIERQLSHVQVNKTIKIDKK